MRPRTLWLAIAAAVFLTQPCHAASIFITGHDPLWHSFFGRNTEGATRLAKTAIKFARDGSPLPFLFIESKTVPVPDENAREADFLVSQLGYSSSDFDVLDAAGLGSLTDFTQTLGQYSALVVASDHGGMLTADELGYLNSHASEIFEYLKSGGGLVAFAQSNAAGLIGDEPRYAFVPLPAHSTDFQAHQGTNKVTQFGLTLGLTDHDVRGNFSHSFFTPAPPWQPLDLLAGNTHRPLTLAYRGPIPPPHSPEPGTFALIVAGFASLFGNRLSKPKHPPA